MSHTECATLDPLAARVCRWLHHNPGSYALSEIAQEAGCAQAEAATALWVLVGRGLARAVQASAVEPRRFSR